MKKPPSLKQQVLNEVRSQLQANGSAVDELVLTKAAAKYARWMNAAYGGSDWASGVAEAGVDGCAASVLGYYEETVANPKGQRTVNQQTFGAMSGNRRSRS